MADAAIEYARLGLEVHFITVQPQTEFASAKGRETMLQLLAAAKKSVVIHSAMVNYEFEFGTPEYRVAIYAQLIATLPTGTPIILSDDASVWQAGTYYYKTYPIIAVLHADEAYYYNIAARYHSKLAAVVCVSQRVSATALRQIPELSPSIVHTIPCGISLPPINYTNKIDKTIKLVYAGRVSVYQKRAGDLLKIALLLAKEQISFHLDIIGDGDAKAGLMQGVEEAGLQNSISFRGWLSQPEVAKYLANADMLLMTSDFEGTPIAMMEALAAGCGMVGTRVSGIEDYEQHRYADKCLKIYTVGDIEDAAKKVVQLSVIAQSVRQIAARQLAENEFSMNVCLNKYINVINSLNFVPQTTVSYSLSAINTLYSRVMAFARITKLKLKGK
jgi:glycosyltransferase involved in cell wall biosynthesis